MSFWDIVDDAVEKGKGDKPIKVTPQELYDYRLETKNTETKITFLENTIAKEKAKSETLEKTLADLNKQIQTSNIEKKGLNSKVEELEKTNNEIKTELQKAIDQITQFQDQMNLLNEQKQQLEIQYNEQNSANNNQMDQLLQSEKQKVAESQQQIEILISQNKELNEQLNELQSTSGNMVPLDQVKEKDKQISDLELQIQSLNNKMQQFQSESISSQDFEILKNQNETLQSELSSSSLQMVELKQEITKLKEALVEKDKKINELSEARSVMKPTLSSSSAVNTSQVNSESNGMRIVCPNCGSTKIREIEDKTKVISYIPKPMYGKKNVCQKCMYEWS